MPSNTVHLRKRQHSLTVPNDSSHAAQIGFHRDQPRPFLRRSAILTPIQRHDEVFGYPSPLVSKRWLRPLLSRIRLRSHDDFEAPDVGCPAMLLIAIGKFCTQVNVARWPRDAQTLVAPGGKALSHLRAGEPRNSIQHGNNFISHKELKFDRTQNITFFPWDNRYLAVQALRHYSNLFLLFVRFPYSSKSS